MDIFYVDLGRAGTGYTGTVADPYAWSDVIASLSAIEQAPLDSGHTFDVGNHFDSAQVNVVYKCRGAGDVLNQAGSIDLTGLRFSPTSGIEITAWDPWTYGLPVFRTPALSDLDAAHAWFKLSASTQVKLKIHGVVFGVSLPNTGADARIVNVESPVLGSLQFYNNVVVDNGSGNQLVSVRGATPEFKTVCTGNTIVYGSTATGASSVFRCENGTLYTGLNFAVQSSAASNTVIFSTSTTVAYSNGNAFGLKPSAITYTGVSPTSFSPDYLGLTPAQGIWGPAQITPANEDPIWSATSGIPVVKTSVFWPVHQGKLLGVGTTSVPASIDVGTLTTDALGLDRAPGRGDAGAFQKTGVTYSQTVHVDLAAVASGTGAESSPVSLADFVKDFGRRAPIDYSLEYVLRNQNSVVLTGLDLGPLAPDTTASNRRFDGAGQVSIIGYKTYAKTLPVLKVASITPNSGVLTTMSALKLEFSGSDFIVPTAPGSAPFRLVNSVVRSTPTATGVIVRSSTGAGEISLFGCSVQLRHSVGTIAGVFLYPAGSTNSEISLCAVSLNNQNSVSAGNVKIRGCYVSTGTAGAPIFTGNSVDAYTKSGNNAFVDPLNADFGAADFTLIPGSAAIGIVPSATQIQGSAATATLTDCRGLTRSAFPNGDTSLDAGAYESNFYVPDPDIIYLDMAKTRSGSGKPGDRWSPADLQTWCDLNSGTVLRKKLQVQAVRSGQLDLFVTGIEADVNGGIDIVSEQLSNPILWESKDFGNITVRACTGLSIALRRVMLRNTTGTPAVSFSGNQLCDLTATSSVFDVKRSSTAWRLVVGQTWSGAGVLTIAQGGAQTNITLSTPAGLYGVPGIVSAISAAGFSVIQREDAIVLTIAGPSTVTPPAGVTAVALVSDIDSDGTVLAVGSSFNSEFSTELGVVVNTISGQQVNAYYCAAQGHTFSSTTKSGNFVQATTKDVHWCGGNQVTVGTQNDCLQLSTQTFAGLRAVDTDMSAFALFDTQLTGIVTDTTASALVTTQDHDTDLTGKLRSQAFSGGAPTYDAGAIETLSLTPTQSFDGTPSTCSTYVTELGYSMNSRALAGDVQFKLVGFAYSNSGYCYWAPERIVASLDAGVQAHTVVTVASNTGFNSDRITVLTTLGTVVVSYGAEFQSGTTASETAKNIASALRSQPGFSKACWCLAAGATVTIYNQRYGVQTPPAVTITGTHLVASTPVPGVESTGVANQVFPTSGYLPWSNIEVPEPRARSFVSRLGESDGVFVYGEVAVIGQVVGSVFEDEVGSTFVYAVSSSPISSKHDRKIAIKRFIFSY